MKKIFSIFGALLAGAMMFSCADQYEEGTPLGTELSVTPEALTEVAGQDAEAITLNVTSNGLWIAQATEWITIEPMTGEGNATVTVTVADNMDPKAPAELDAPRKGTITFAVGKDNVVVVEVAQLGDPTKAAMKLPYTETFAESQGRFKIEDVKLPEGSTYVWKHDNYNGVYYMKASGYVGGKKVSDSYLVSPVIDLTAETNAALTFEHAGKFFGDLEAEAQVWVREEGAEKWAEQLEFTHMATQDYTFYNSGEISLKDFVGKKIQVGWRYVSTTDAAGTWEVNNVKFYDPDKTEEGGEEPEEPETPEEPEEPETPAELTLATIADVLAVGQDNAIGDKYVEGIVISNGEINNLTSQKGMYIQDATAGLQLRLSENHTIAFGSKVKVDLSGVNLGAYNGAVQVSVDSSKVTVLSTDNAVEAKTVAIADFLANKYEGQYVAIEGVQVAAADLEKTWVMGGAHTSINMEDAEGNTFIVFSSKYATYGAETVAQGSGTLKGIAAINNGTIQIIFGQQSDYAGLTGERFGATVEPEEPETPEEPVVLAGAGEGTLESPYDVTRALDIIAKGVYTTENVYTAGVVSGVKEGYNAQYGNATYYISVDGTNAAELTVFRGKYLESANFTAENQVKVGDKVVICGALVDYNGTAEINSGNYLVSIETVEVPEPEEPETPEEPEEPETPAAPAVYTSAAAFVCTASVEGDLDNRIYPLIGKVDGVEVVTTIDDKEVSGVKFGTSKYAGYFTSKPVEVEGDQTLGFYAVGWKDDDATLYVRVDGGEAHAIKLAAHDGATGSAPYVNLTARATDYYTINFTGLTAESVIEFATDSSFTPASNDQARAILFGANFVE